MISIEKSLYAHFKEFAKDCKNQRFVFDEDRSYTASEAFNEIIAIANNLYDYGVKEGSLVAFRCTRSVDAYLIYLALEFLGATVALTNTHQTVQDFINDMDVPMKADFIISNERAYDGTAANGNWEVFGHGPLEVCYPAREEAQRFPEGNDVLAPATIYFTSGSTGKNKGAIMNQRVFVQRSIDLVSQDWYREGDIIMVILPIYHAFGHALVQTAYFTRYSLFFPRKNNVEYALECIEKYKVNGMDAVPSYFYALAQANEREKRDVSSLRMGFTAGAPITPEQHHYVEQILGMAVHIQYAMSECLSISNTFPTDGPEIRSTTVGRIHRNATMILDPNGNQVPLGQEGEICVIGPVVMSGYYGNEEETKRAIDKKGIFHTGDLGYIDANGCLRISGRLKDIIIRNGINLSPVKIEKAIRSVSGVEQAVVVGVQHKTLGEAPCALVVLHKGCEMTEDELKAELLTRMPKNEVPVKILFAEAVPLNQIGKPDKQSIKKTFAELNI